MAKIKRTEWTNKEDLFLADNYEIMSNKELAAKLNRSESAIRNRLRVLFLNRGKPEYAYYKEDEFIASGTIAELAEMFGVKGDTIRFYMTPTYEKRGVKNGYGRIKVVRI